MTYPTDADEPRFTAKEKLDAADREVKYRVRVYERLIRDGKMTKQKADREVAIMRAIRRRLFPAR